MNEFSVLTLETLECARLRSESPAALVFLTLRFLAGPWGPE